MTAESAKRWRLVAVGVAVVIVAGAVLSLPPGRSLGGRFFRSLRVQKVQAVNVDLSAFTDPNANPALHQMVAQMISDKVTVTTNQQDQPAGDAATASQLAGFRVQLLAARKDAPKLVVTGKHAVELTVDRNRLQAIFNEAGHPELAVPESLDGAAVSVTIPQSVEAQYGTCPGPPQNSSAGTQLARNITGPAPQTTTEYADCVRLREGPSPQMSVPQDLDIEHLAEIGLEVAGMSPTQAHDFLTTVNWQATLVMSVPRYLRSYQAVRVSGADATLLTMGGRRGPGYTLLWSKNGMVYTITGFGDSGDAVVLADSLK